MVWMDLSASSREHMRRHSSRRHASQPHMHPPPLRGFALPAVGWGVGRRPRRVGMTRPGGCGAVSGTGREATFGVNVRAFHRGAVPYVCERHRGGRSAIEQQSSERHAVSALDPGHCMKR